MKTKSFGFLVIVVLVASLMIAEIAFSRPWQGWRGSGGWGMGMAYQNLYDPAKVETISGEIVSIELTVPMRKMNQGVALIVKTDKEAIPVHLGPSWYVERLDVKFTATDKVEVKGVRTTFAGKPVIMAAEIKKGDQSLILRDASGVPVWAGAGWKR